MKYEKSRRLLEIWLLYLRKSRQDDPNETVEEVLAKHEAILQEYAEKELGGRIPSENIYREVISGESIDEREEIKKVLSRMEDPAVAGVLVIEPQRLSRGDLEDCGRLINSLRFTKTKVATPMMTYNLENKMERKFFQDELLRGRDYLEYTKEILMRGRIAAIKRGCYIAKDPPYGYDKIVIGKDHTLRPNENADVVRMIFDWYANEHLTAYGIAKRLNEMGIPSATGLKWMHETVRNTLKNAHYIGKVVFNKRPARVVLENGVQTIRRKNNDPEEIILAEGKHPAIISMDVWERVRERQAGNPLPHKNTLKNPLAGMFYCSKCGKAMELRRHPKAEDRYTCPKSPRCIKSATAAAILDALLLALEEAELPDLQAKAASGDGNAREVQKRLIAKLNKQMEEYRDQEETQYELLETKKYTQELFDRRNAVLRQKMEECQAALYKATSILPKEVNYEERVVSLKDAIAMLKNPDAEIPELNRVLKTIIDRIEYDAPENTGHFGKRQTDSFNLDITLRL